MAQDGSRRVASILEQGVLVHYDLLTSPVKVSSEQLPDLYSSLLEGCDILDLGGGNDNDTRYLPELYCTCNPIHKQMHTH